MKTSLTKLSSSLILVLVAFPLWAKPVAQVIEVHGSVFVIAPDGKATSLKVNQHLEEKSEVMVEEGASVTLNDYYDATYHMTGGTHLKFFNKSVQLKRGKTWIQSQNSRHPLALTTANGHVDFWKGEFITTFDQATSRSQVLVVNGDVEVSNILDKDMKYTVSGGSFTLIDPEVENGLPRTPTKVGLASLNAALAEFKQLPEKLKDEAVALAPARGIASVEEMKKVESVKKGQIIYMSSNRLPASVGSAHTYYKKTVKKKVELPSAPIRFYGASWKATTPVTTIIAAPRTPASIAPAPAIEMPAKALPSVKIDPEFGESLKTHQVRQPKYSKDLDSLIHDLKSY